MWLVDWYCYKVEQCALKAKMSADHSVRAKYEEEHKLWCELARKEIDAIKAPSVETELIDGNFLNGSCLSRRL